MGWVYLIIAGLLEMGWPVGLKLAWDSETKSIRPGPAVAAGVSMALSGIFLFLAQRQLPIGTAYAVWTGIGTIGTFVLGVLLLGEPATAARWACVCLIAAGIVGLRVFSAH